MIQYKSEEDILKIKKSGQILHDVLEELKQIVKPGVEATVLDQKAYDLIKEKGGDPAFLGYMPYGARSGFPNTICLSINEEVVHGTCYPGKVVKDGDVVSVDCGVILDGYYSDSAFTVIAGKGSERDIHMVNVCRESLNRAIEACKIGNTLGDVGYSINSYVEKNGFTTIKDLVGHGVGFDLHEEPEVLNYGKPKEGLVLKEGMVIAIEPMITYSTSYVREGRNNAYITEDLSPSAHFEHTVAITKNGPLILT